MNPEQYRVEYVWLNVQNVEQRIQSQRKLGRWPGAPTSKESECNWKSGSSNAANAMPLTAKCLARRKSKHRHKNLINTNANSHDYSFTPSFLFPKPDMSNYQHRTWKDHWHPFDIAYFQRTRWTSTMSLNTILKTRERRRNRFNRITSSKP